MSTCINATPGGVLPTPLDSDPNSYVNRARSGGATKVNGVPPSYTATTASTTPSSHYMRGCTIFYVRAVVKGAEPKQIGGVDVADEVYIVPNQRNTHQSSRSCTPTEEEHNKHLETLRWNHTTSMFGTCLSEEFESILEDVVNYRITEVPAEALHGLLRLGGLSILMFVTKLIPVANGIHFPDFGSIYEVGGLSYVLLPTSSNAPPRLDHHIINNNIGSPSSRPRSSPTHTNRPSDDDLKQYLTILERYCTVKSHSGAKGLYISFGADISVPISAHPGVGSKSNSPPISLMNHPEMRSESMGEIMLPESTNSLSSTPDGSNYPSKINNKPSSGSRGSKYRSLFSWNANLCIGAFPESRYVPPTMRGFVDGASVGGIKIALFSRQSAKYAGTRYNRRGLGKDGVPANFCESEQVMWNGAFDLGGRPLSENDDADTYPHVTSFTVFRGSVPVDWAQRADLSSKPQTVIHADPHIAFSDHMKILDSLYPQHHIGCVNLMTAKGIEAKLTEIFQAVTTDYNADILAGTTSEPASTGSGKHLSSGRFTPLKSQSPTARPSFSAAVSPMLNAHSNSHPRPVSFLHYNLGDRLHDKKSFDQIQEELVTQLAAIIAETIAKTQDPLVSFADAAASTAKEHDSDPKPSNIVDPKSLLLTVDSWRYRVAKTTPIALAKATSSLGHNNTCTRLVVDRKEHQDTIIRVNCLDCLDRTNVAQSMLATAVIEQQLAALGVDTTSAEAKAVEGKVKELWIDHGHRISMLYAGSNAHFSDIIRTGRPAPKTLSNPFPMAPIAMRRFILQNFHDGQKQDCLSLVTGHHIPCASRDPEQSTLHRPEVPNTIIKCSFICVMMFWALLVGDHIFVQGGAFTREICFGYFSFISMISGMLYMVVKRGKALVATPLLR